MFTSWNITRRGQTNLGIVFMLIFLLTFSIAEADISDSNAFPVYHYIWDRISDFNYIKEIGLSRLLIIVIAGTLYFLLFSLFFLGMQYMTGNILKSDVGIAIQFNLINTKLGSFICKRRLGYLMNLALWVDLLQLIVLGILHIKSFYIHVENGHFDSRSLNIEIISRMFLGDFPFLLLILAFGTIINPIKMQSIEYLKSHRNAVMLHKSKVPKSSFSMPPNKQIYTEWNLLDELEYDYLIKLRSCIDISAAVVYFERENDVNHWLYLLEQYKKYYMKPHVLCILCLDSDEDRVDTEIFDYCYKYKYCKSNFDPSVNIIIKFENILVNTKDKYIIDLLKRLSSEVVDCYNNLYRAPYHFYIFYRQILNRFTLRQAINGLFDIIDLAYRLSIFSYCDNFKTNNVDIIPSMGNLAKMRKLLQKYEYINFSQSLYINFLNPEMKKIIWDKLHLDVTEEVNCEFLLRIIEYLRNVTKAHGFIKDSELQPMFELMFCLSLYVFWKLDICSVSIYADQEEGRAVLKFKGQLMKTFTEYAFFDSKKYLYITTNRYGTFINMLTGEMKNRITS